MTAVLGEAGRYSTQWHSKAAAGLVGLKLNLVDERVGVRQECFDTGQNGLVLLRVEDAES